MKQQRRRMLSILLTLCLLIGLSAGLAVPAAAEGGITRAQLAVLLCDKFGYSAAQDQDIPDIGDCDEKEKASINAVAEQEIMMVDSEGNFNPDNTVTRAETAQILMKATNGDENAPAQELFQDVNSNDWYAVAVNALVAQGIFTAEDAINGGFAPTDVATEEVVNRWLSRVDMGEDPEPEAPADGLTRAELAVLLYNQFIPDTTGVDQDFTDLSNCSDEQKNAINAVADAGIMAGHDTGAFDPSGGITRAEVAAILCTAVGGEENQAPDQTIFNDMSGHWAAYAVNYLVDVGVLTADDAVNGGFAPNDLVTETVVTGWLARVPEEAESTARVSRADMAVALYDKFYGEKTAADQGFTDIDDLTPKEQRSINVLASQGIVSGVAPGTFDPNAGVTRAEAVVLLWRATGSKSNPNAAEVYYADVGAGDWYTPAIHCLTAAGILYGEKPAEGQELPNFNPNGSVNVATLTTLLERYDSSNFSGFEAGVSRIEMVMEAYETFKGGPLEAELSGNFTTSLKDLDACTEEQREAVLFFEELGVINGYQDYTFRPDAPASNLQIATFLQGCAQLGAQTDTQADTLALNFSNRLLGADPAVSLLDGQTQSDPAAEAFAFLESLGVNVDAAEANPNAPCTVTNLGSWNAALKPDAPTFSPAGGTYTAAQTVTITAPGGGKIHYTTNGADPTVDAAVYTGPITVSTTTTIKAVAEGENNALSEVASVTYTIKTTGSNTGGGSTGGGSSSSSDDDDDDYTPPSNTQEDQEESVTTTVTNPDGSVTETTKNPDGSSEVVKTDTDGTVTTTLTDAQGNKTETVEHPDGSSETTVERADGSSSATAVAADGTVTAQATLSQAALTAAGGDAAALPLAALPVTSDRESAPAVTVSLPVDSAKVEIPVENPTAGTVAVLVKADGTEEVIKTSLTTESGVAVTLSDGDTVKIVDNTQYFADVPASYWGADAVTFASSRELFNGVAEGVFDPDAAMSRGMIVTVLARLEGVDTSTGEHWYDAGAQWAMENGISDGTNLDQALTREQLATMLYRYVGEPAASGSVDSYPDGGSVSAYAADAMAWAVANGLISGMGDGTLNPQGQATRAQVATILMRFCGTLA